MDYTKPNAVGCPFFVRSTHIWLVVAGKQMPQSVVGFHPQLPCEAKPVLMESDQIVLQLPLGVSRGTLLEGLISSSCGWKWVVWWCESWPKRKLEGRRLCWGWGGLFPDLFQRFVLGQYFPRKPVMPLGLIFLPSGFAALLLLHEFSKAAGASAPELSVRTTSINVM